ncbi:hypothetical protein GGQ62_001632 [Polymorphobacter fuscus]|uniref:autotransporter outer membrane beta-barrel domain-containing protein n=1 Tax=Sandarakinorhabdus fusca TaxID=1439888 RepID=UPI001430FD6B|nr:autotransporter outer membrane beta-barrel domain-containing protein [Polymorphobacter fuscus]NJC08634.1 hypothetical protein [Polymorphobacter fuscus]
MNQLRGGHMLAIGGSALLLLPAPVRAQCSNSPAPAPPPPLTFDVGNQGFGPGVPYNLVNNGVEGCAGSDGGVDTDGGPGFAGQAAGPISSTATNIAIGGASVSAPGEYGYGLEIVAGGGAGGNGGDAGAAAFSSVRGGDGGAGGASARIDIAFSGTIGPSAGGNLAETGLYVVARGGNGGSGGSTGTFGAGMKTGGTGGAAGAGGTILASGSGNVTVAGYALTALAIGGTGSSGGSITTTDAVNGLQGGAGGAGGLGGSAAARWGNGSISAGYGGLFVTGSGGDGGAGGSAGGASSNAGGDGGAGGNGGSASAIIDTATIKVSGGFTPADGGIVAWAVGGAGGAGGSTGGAIGSSAGNGGNGGGGGTAAASVLGGADVTGAGKDPISAIFVNANGGAGGAGGSADSVVGEAGGGGYAGAGGSASLVVGSATQTGTVTARGALTNAALVQSVGGGGGGGGQADFNAQGGAGAAGGNGGVASAQIVNGIMLANGASSSALIVQSIGGGGGVGGNTVDIALGYSVAIGGNGGLGGDGNAVTLTLGAASILGALDPFGDGGVLAQSIGGAGGAGGSATSTGSAAFSMTIGGDGGSGGIARDVLVTSAALVGTYGDHAAGIEAQSIGGGGGKGGAATSFNVTLAVPAVAIAVGGKGGIGGVAGNATIDNTGEVSTFGADAYGLKAQSIGGGGGSGGAAVARAVTLSPDKRIPAVSISVAMGGSGGSGNRGGTASLTNGGIITTAGDGAHAMMAQSIGGGGGTGGDSTAASYSGGDDGAVKISVAVAVGGAGGEGGIGGAATATNSNLLLTLGADAYGLVAQSVGGGGGIGGGGDATATAGKAKAGFSAAIAVGGGGGTGGNGGTAGATNSGGIATGGDGADGIFAQSVGGGGGAGGGGVGAANGPTLSISVGVGGNGGAGGDGGGVSVQNAGGIVTRGTDAAGLFAQSVGGGGGKGGKGGATSGGVNPINQAKSLADTLAAGFNLGGNVTQPVDGIFKIAGIGNEILKSAQELSAIAKQLAGGPYSIGAAANLDVAVSVGGRGGAAGTAGGVQVANNGQIATFGAQSDGIFAQSVGGGGGKGGAASSTDKSADDGRNQAAVGVGGAGGAGGNGGVVDVSNARDARVDTGGVLGFGIVAQSVGGGGGGAGLAGTVAGSLRSLSVSVGGSGGAQGSGGAVAIENDGIVSTGGKHGIGMLVQSIGGGGGLVRTMTTDQTFDPALIVDNPQGRLGDVHGLTLSFGGGGNPVGNAGTVVVDMAGSVATAGRTAHAIVAQSIGGGGGAVFGGQLLANNVATNTGTGNGAAVAVTLTAGASIATIGDAAYGILAQSIGGGGGLAGDLANVGNARTGVDASGIIAAGTGSAANVTVALTGAKLATQGRYAPAVLAQSVGGGGGLLGFADLLMAGTAGGSGAAGETVMVKLVATSISATGVRSPGIVVQNAGSTSGTSVLSIDATSAVTGGLSDVPQSPQPVMAGAIAILGGATNTINNAGLIAGIDGTAAAAIAINSIGGPTVLNNSGTVTGSFLNGAGANVVNNLDGGVFDARDVINLGVGGRFNNLGTLEIGGVGRNATTVLTGDFVQGTSGRLVIAADIVTGASDVLAITGRAQIAGAINVHPTTVTNRSVTVLTATQGVTLDPALVAAPRIGLYALPVTVVGNALQIQPRAFFSESATGLGRNRRTVADHLQALFESGASFDAGFNALAAVRDLADYDRALSSLSAGAPGAIAAFRFVASQDFVANMESGCSTSHSVQGNCVWSRALGSSTVQQGSVDSAGFNVRAGALQIGAQFQVADDWSVAASVGYEHSRFSGETSPFEADGDSALVGAHVRYRQGPWQISGAVDAGYGWYSGTRTIAVAQTGSSATASRRVWQIGTHGRLAYEQTIGTAAFITPFADFHLVHVRSGGYTERGPSPFNLTVLSHGRVALGGTAGVEVGGRIALSGDRIMRPFARAAVARLSNDWTVEARLAALSPQTPTFRIETPTPGTLGRFAIGAELLGKRVDLRVQYLPEFGANYRVHAGMARLSYRY